MAAIKRPRHVFVFAATALFLYQYLGRLEPAGPATIRAFEIVRADLKHALGEAGIDADSAEPADLRPQQRTRGTL